MSVAERLKNLGADSGHDSHVDHDIRRIGQLDANVRNRRADRSHAERNDIHRATLHTAFEVAHENSLHVFGVVPVVVRAGVFLGLRTDKCAIFNARDITGVRADEKAVGSLRGVERDKRSGLHGLGAEFVVFLLRPVAPVDAVRRAEGGDFVDPREQFLVTGHHGFDPAFFLRILRALKPPKLGGNLAAERNSHKPNHDITRRRFRP